MRTLKLFICLLAIAIGTEAKSSERILSFDSDIRVREDGTMTVTETIAVQSEGKQIKRGIYRDFPTDYTDRLGHRYRVGFEIIKVRRDGYTEAYHTERRGNGVRIYIGQKDVKLPPGKYTYTLTYRTNRQLGFFADHDELYWNVTGNDWAFPIDKASAKVSLPKNIPPSGLAVEGYTGPYGAKGQDYEGTMASDGIAHFKTTRPLSMREGLTIILSWPKGYIAEPTKTERITYLMKDNRSVFGATLGLIILFLYYLAAWIKVGKDPAPGVIIPHYYPPEGFSPASMRFIRRMGHDDKSFATALVNLAVNDYVTIADNGDEYTILRSEKPEGSDLAPGERALMKKLFGSKSYITLKNENHTKIKSAIDAHQKSLARDYEKIYFKTNLKYFIPGILIMIMIIAVMIILLPPSADRGGAVFMSVWLFFWTLACIALVGRAARMWRGAQIMPAISASFFALAFLFFEGVGIWFMAEIASWGNVAVLIFAVLLSGLFYDWLKSPTRAGRRLLDKVAGFRHYLNIAEKDELNFKHGSARTPDQFEAYLPFAMALDVEQAWAEKFAASLAEVQADGSRYHPRWYSGHHWEAGRLGRFSSRLGSSLAASIAASSTAPGSSSGAGGGGSSGGGGGGGGGGGW
ncbi:MAG: DUF2207 domain-containing protein [Gammaproteobacteria bacterium]